METDALTKTFGSVTAVRDLTFKVKEGEIFGFLGPNGAGKTTTVRVLCCLISKTRGSAWIGGHEIGDEEESLVIRKMVGFLPENVGLYDELSAYRNLDFFAKLYDCPESQRKEGIERLLKMLGLWERRDSPVGTFSKGMKQKIAIARALVHDPRVIFLDEPTANLDPESAKTVRDFILELRKERRTVFLNTHNLDEAQRVCDRIGVLKTSLLAVDSPQKLRESLWGKKTVVHLVRVDDRVVKAVKDIGFTKAEVYGDKVILDVNDGDVDNPRIVSAMVGAGGQVQYVTELRPTLEDIYLKLVGGQAI